MLEASLNRAYELTRSIADAVSQDDWLAASQLADERSPLLMSLRREQSDEALAVIREIQSIDSAVMQRVGGAREAMTSRFQDAQRRVAAASFYQKTGQLR